MTGEKVRGYLAYIVPLVLGAGLLGCGMGGCCETCEPGGYTFPNTFPNWPLDTQVEFLRGREEQLARARQQFEATPKSSLSVPVVFVPLMLSGLCLIAAVVVIGINESTSG
jgi:hypothetical protein